jgi:FAD/FMN-containing dehydrogenase
VVGYTLGGGIGWLARRHGLAGNSVLVVEAVTADGGIVRADAGSEPDLFWAVRGGGGSFAVVTALEFALYPVAEVYARAVRAPGAAREVLHTWRELVATAPDELTSLGRLMQFRRFPRSPSPSAVARSCSSRPPTAGRKPRARLCCRRCASSARRWTRSPRFGGGAE